MRTIMLLVKRNLQEKKIYSVVILFLVMLSGLSLMTAFGTVLRTEQIYEEVTAKTNSPQMLLGFEASHYNENYMSLLENNKYVEDVLVENYIYSSFRYEDEDKVGCFFISYNPDINPYPTKYAQGKISLSENEVLLPSSMQDTYQIEKNDIISFKLGDKIYDYTVKDFIEDPFFGSSISTSKRIYISDDEFERIQTLSNNTPILNYKVLSVYTDKENANQGIFDSIYNEFTGEQKISWSVDELLLKSGNVLLPSLVAVIFIIFSIFLFVITALILRYAILETVESDFVKIGVFKALGISNTMIMLTFIIRYLIITIIGTLIATMLSVYVTPFFGSIILNLSGLWWSGNVSFTVVLFITVGITLFVLLIVTIATLRVLKISPVKAIAVGKGSSKKRGILSINLLKIAWLPLNLKLSIKQMFSKLKQYSTLVIISILFSFLVLSMGTLTIFFNDKDEMVNFLGFDSSDILLSDTNLMVQDNESLLKLADIISEKYNVDNSIGFQSATVKMNEHTVTTLVYDTFIENQNINLLDGFAPKDNNEISITPTIQTSLGLEIGDTVSILDDKENNQLYKIVGIHQSVEDMGNNIKILTKGYQNINAEYLPRMIKINFSKSIALNKKDVIKEFQEYDTSIVIKDGKEEYIDTVDIIQKALLIGTTVMFVISLLMICLSTFLLSAITIAREWIENGIMKALGYTNHQLRLQLMIRFILVSLFGATLGTILATGIADLFFTAIFNSIGIANITLIWNPVLIIGTIMSICLTTLISSFILSRRIKRLEARDLITE